jgi:hypothetical protein
MPFFFSHELVILSAPESADGEGILFADVVLGKVDGPTVPIPDGFWIPDLSEDTKNYWKDALTGPFRKYYEKTALPFYLKRWADENP